jgi:photosystem II stability/assembly factor-like uncharacterized protein
VDGGRNWLALPTKIDPLLSYGPTIISFHLLNDKTGYLLGYYMGTRLYKTSDAGLNWTRDSTFTATSELLQRLYYDKIALLNFLGLI